MTPKYELARFRRVLGEARPTKPRGAFPTLQWAWPTGGRDLLLRAAILGDAEAAATALREWLATHAQGQIRLPEQRLLLTISQRLPTGVLNRREKVWLGAVEHKLSSICTQAQQEAKPTLAALADAEIDLMVFKGAARSAIDGPARHTRFTREIDLLVRPQDYERAVRCVLKAGWKCRAGTIGNLSRRTGLNFLHGEYGEVDLHQYPYHQVVVEDARPTALWDRASKCAFLGHTVLVPSPTDRLMMAIAHGSIGGHGHSDWLVDCAVLITNDAIDWPLFEKLTRGRDLEVGCAIALRYLAGPLDVPVPEGVLDRLDVRIRGHPWRRAAALLEARPRREHSLFSALARAVTRGLRIVRSGKILRQVELARTAWLPPR